MQRAVIGLLVLTLAACGAPNLDRSIAGESAATVRQHIVDHGDWKERLSGEQLDQLAAFIAEYAGTVDAGRAAEAPGYAVWRANECRSCHVLAAGGPDE